jgi:hypothetical protein
VWREGGYERALYAGNKNLDADAKEQERRKTGQNPGTCRSEHGNEAVSGGVADRYRDGYGNGCGGRSGIER